MYIEAQWTGNSIICLYYVYIMLQVLHVKLNATTRLGRQRFRARSYQMMGKYFADVVKIDLCDV